MSPLSGSKLTPYFKNLIAFWVFLSAKNILDISKKIHGLQSTALSASAALVFCVLCGSNLTERAQILPDFGNFYNAYEHKLLAIFMLSLRISKFIEASQISSF